MRIDVAVRRLDQSLQRLAWQADRQVEHVARWRVGPDELALEFDDAFRVALGLVAQGLLPESVGTLLRPVDQILAEMTEGSAEAWTTDAVAHSPAWERLRSTAREALGTLRGLGLSSSAQDSTAGP
ncbi:hypothetical protein [Streptomyces sp. NPDC052225]|uniref:hypothetical protein n=1 Tax=Streptomyces sp. NPDC052225 TaxID=3154949 RepID=UPI0034328D36